mmetsp:Transcript_36838/g.38205  ORF Transcript_36838/g.38205 Transcript_36838/m.38205 type:complete len:167 (-) Transcript_36838:119-619(-)
MSKTAVKGVLRDIRVHNLDIFKADNHKNIFNKKYLTRKYYNYLSKAATDDFSFSGVLCLVILGSAYTMVLLSKALYGKKNDITVKHDYIHNKTKLDYMMFFKVNPQAHYNHFQRRYTGDQLFQMRMLPKRPEEVFKGGEETVKRVAYVHNKHNPEFFTQKIVYRKD